MPKAAGVLSSHDISLGTVLWLLPPKPQIGAASGTTSAVSAIQVLNITRPEQTPDQEFYNHPIMVISRLPASPDLIHFVQLTSFGGPEGRGLPPNRHREFLAIAPAEPNPLLTDYGDSTYKTLKLRNGVQMNKAGYVKISCVYSMPWKAAKPYWTGTSGAGKKARLDKASLTILLGGVKKVAGYEWDVQHSGVHASLSSGIDSHIVKAAKPQHVPQGRNEVSPATIASPAPPLSQLPSYPPIPATTRPPVSWPIPPPPRIPNTLMVLPAVQRAIRDYYHEERQPLLPTHSRHTASDDSYTWLGLLGWLFVGFFWLLFQLLKIICLVLLWIVRCMCCCRCERT